MPIPDSFNPLMDIGQAKDKGNPAPLATPGDNATTLADATDPTANLGTTQQDVEIAGADSPATGTGSANAGAPSDVNRFNGGSV